MKENTIRASVAAAAMVVGAAGGNLATKAEPCEPGQCAADINGDGQVNFRDLQIMRDQMFISDAGCPVFHDFVGSVNCVNGTVTNSDEAQININRNTDALQSVSFYQTRRVVKVPEGVNTPPVACGQVSAADAAAAARAQEARNATPHDEIPCDEAGDDGMATNCD